MSPSEFFHPVLDENVEAIAALIAAGHSLEQPVDGGRHNHTPLGMAALELRLRSLEALVLGGADVNFVGPDGLRPIQLAFGGANRKTKHTAEVVIRYLIDHGAEVTEGDLRRMESLDGLGAPMYTDEAKQYARAAFERQAQ